MTTLIADPRFIKVTKKQWYYAGGFENSNCWRRYRNGNWQYFYQLDNSLEWNRDNNPYSSVFRDRRWKERVLISNGEHPLQTGEPRQ